MFLLSCTADAVDILLYFAFQWDTGALSGNDERAKAKHFLWMSDSKVQMKPGIGNTPPPPQRVVLVVVIVIVYNLCIE